MSKKTRISSLVPNDVVKEAIQMSKESQFSEVYILSDGSGFLASGIYDIGVEYYKAIASFSEGKLDWVIDEYEEIPDDDE